MLERASNAPRYEEEHGITFKSNSPRDWTGKWVPRWFLDGTSLESARSRLGWMAYGQRGLAD